MNRGDYGRLIAAQLPAHRERVEACIREYLEARDYQKVRPEELAAIATEEAVVSLVELGSAIRAALRQEAAVDG